MIGKLYHWFVKMAFGLRLRDVDCDFRLMRRSVFDKVVSNIQGVKASGGRVIAITSRDEPALAGKLDYEIRIPETIDMFTPILSSVPLQLLAYYIADLKGTDVDQPRNLAKTVTVE